MRHDAGLTRDDPSRDGLCPGARRGVWVWLVLGLAACGLTGCEPTVAPGAGRTDAVALPTAPPPETALSIGVIVPEEGLVAANVYEQTIRNAAARENVLCEVVRSRPGAQAETISQLAGQGHSALIVVPEPEAPIGPALASARSKLPVLVLDRVVTVEGGEPVPTIAYTPVRDAARQMVESAQKQAQAAGYAADAPAVVVVNGPYDAPGREKLAALHEALDAAKIPTLPDVVFTGYQGEARQAFEPLLAAHPEVALVLCVEDQAGRSLAQIRGELPKEPRRFALATFAHEDATLKLATSNTIAAIADLNPEPLARRAYQAAMSLARGEAPSGLLLLEPRILVPDGPEREFFVQQPRPGAPAPTGREDD